MARRRKQPCLGLCVTMHFTSVILVIGMLAMAGSGASLAQEIDLSASQRKALGIETAAVSLASDSPEARRFTGQVMIPPGGSSPVASPFDAVLIEMRVVPGMTVTAGTPVARLYSPDYEANRTNLETQRLTAIHMGELARRAEELGAMGLRSRQEVDEARHDAASAELELATLRRSLSIVRAGSGSGEFELTALRDGQVMQILVAPGQSVARAEPLVIFGSGDDYWLELPVPEAMAANLAIGAQVDLSASDQAGEIVAMDPGINPATRSVNIYVDLPQGPAWRVGQLADAVVSFGASGNALSVPARAIVRFGPDTAVFVERAGGVERVFVEIVSQDRSISIVSGDLQPGDRVVVSGLAALKNLAEAS